MANVLIAWELGAGFGHILRYKTLITHLLDQGHRVWFAARDLSSTHQALVESRLTLIQAPVPLKINGPVAEPVENYAYILNNTGFNDATGLEARIRSWRFIYDSIKPDVTIFDHCPTGLLAAKSYNFAKLHCGNGFTIPPATKPFPPLRESPTTPEALLAFERQVLGNVNTALIAIGDASLEQLQDFLAVDRELLLTVAALDRYGERHGGEYIGPVFADNHGKPINWSVGKQPRVFGYLRNDSAIEKVVAAMKKQSAKTVIYAPEINQPERDKLCSKQLRLIDTPASLPTSIRECRFVINNGNLGTVTMSLLAGVPLLLIPNTLEQYLNARCVEQLGAGLVVHKQSNVETISNQAGKLLMDDSFTKQARRFAREHRNFDSKEPSRRLIEAVETQL